MQSVADTAMNEAAKVKPTLQQSQDVGNARNVGHLLRKAAGTNYRWPKREARFTTIGRAIEAKASKYVGGQIIPLHTLDARYGAKEVDVYLAGLQSYISPVSPCYPTVSLSFILCH